MESQIKRMEGHSLDKLWDALSEDTLTETLEELRAASAEDYGDPDFLANECRDVAFKAIAESDRRKATVLSNKVLGETPDSLSRIINKNIKKYSSHIYGSLNFSF